MKDEVRVGAVALDSEPGRTEQNLEKIAGWCRRAAEQGIDLVLFPELSITGFIPNHPAGDHAQWLRDALRGAWKIAEELEGNALRRLAEISADTGVFIAAGLLENAGNMLFNSHVLMGEGRLYGAWQKMHIPLFEMQIYNGGAAPVVADTPLGRIGANICFDAFLPESTRLLAVQQCDIVMFPFAADPTPATPSAWGDWAAPIVKARCSENGVFGVACNYFGAVRYAGASQRFPGGAFVVAPTGDVIAEELGTPSKPHMLTSCLTREALLEARSRFEYAFRFRRPELYQSLVGKP